MKEFTKHVTQFTGKRLKRNLLMKLQVQKIGEFFENTFLERSRVTAYLLKVHKCRFENLPISLSSYKNNMLKI